MKKILLFLTIILIVSSFASCDKPNNVDKPTSSSETQVNDQFVCMFSIECSTAISHADQLDAAIKKYLPDDGTILSPTDIPFSEGESVADVLRRVCDENGIALETSGASGTLYVEGIGHLYEFDCGEGSGWMYKVNGEFPNFGCDSYLLSAGDTVEWIYTCDFGNDVGGHTAD